LEEKKDAFIEKSICGMILIWILRELEYDKINDTEQA
jgi:hypothetical protein